MTKHLLIFVALGCALDAASIATSTTCTTAVGINTGPNSCKGVIPNPPDSGMAEATASLSYQVSGNTITVDGVTQAQATPTIYANLDQFYNSATANEALTLAVYIGGSGTGYVALSSGWISASGDGQGFGLASLKFGPESEWCPVHNGPPACDEAMGLLPINLGQVYILTYTAGSDSSSSSSLTAISSAGVDQTFSVFGSDGFTPVSVAEVPEPLPSVLSAVGLLLVFILNLVKSTQVLKITFGSSTPM